MLDKLFGIHADALQLKASRMEVLSTNIANADTPGFKAKDVDFREVLSWQLGTGSLVDPDNGQARMIPLEIKFRSEPQPRYSRVSTNPAELDGLELTHERGAVAMARSQAPDSASAQFYVALRPLPELDGRYAVFGRVVDGMEVVDAIQQGDRITKAAITQ